MLKWNGHTHTPYCRHGSPADAADYLEQAIRLGFDRYTFSEHPPLPQGWVDNEPLMRELAMDPQELPTYMDYVEGLKRSYAGKIEVTVGLELDYLPGRTDFADELIAPYADRLEDLLVSVHYLPGKGGMRCLDFTPADFREGILEYYGSMERVVEEYYDHVEQALEWAASLPGRKRLGHVQLIEKFRDALPPIDDSQMNERLTRIKPKLLASGMGLDVNTAGLRVGTCGKAYVPVWFLQECLASGIDCVYGSDAHKPEDAGAGWDWFEQAVGQR